MTISYRLVLYIFFLFVVSCSRLYHGSWNQPYFDENVQPDKLGKKVSSWEDGARIPEDEFSVEWWYIDAKLEDSSIIVAYFYKVHNIANQYFIGLNYTSPDGVDTFKLKRFKKNDVSFSTDSCNVQFGKNYFKGNLNKYSVYLDPKDFEGGELLLMPDFQGIKTDLQKHEICFFPSWLPHKVTPVTKGIRKSIVGWVHGPDFV